MAPLPVGFIISLVMEFFILWHATRHIQSFRKQIDVINIRLFIMNQTYIKYMHDLPCCRYSNIAW